MKLLAKIVCIKDNEMFINAHGFCYHVSIWPPSDAYPQGVVDVKELPSHLYPVRGHMVCSIPNAGALEDVLEVIVNEYAPNRAKYLSRWQENKLFRDFYRRYQLQGGGEDE